MKKGKKKIITLCSSANFFAEMLEVDLILKKAGFSTLIPFVAKEMKKSGDFRVEKYKTWFKDPRNYKQKTIFMKNHFDEVAKSDLILVLNYEKKGIRGYIGGATLLEMGVAFYLKKKIYVLNPIDESSSYKEEILAMNPTILNGDLARIRK